MIIRPGIIGIDISKAHLDIFDAERGRQERLPNSAEAAHALAQRLRDRQNGFAVFEATGHYDRHLRTAFAVRQIAHSRVNPTRARNFARSLGLLAKTDGVDARMLAIMGHLLPLRVEAPDDPGRQSLASLHKRRDQLVVDRAREQVRLSEMPDHQDSLRSHIAWLNGEISRIDALIAAVVRENRALADDIGLLRSVPGIGPVTAAILIAQMPELGALTPKTVAALAGLAPFNADSGKFRGIRRISGGRRRVRQALYMAAITAKRCMPRFTSLYEQMMGKGKPPKLAIIAIARKLIVILNAILRDRKAFQPG